MTQHLPKHVYAVILAGGSGTRFWPKSRQKNPKQLCKLGGSALTMIEQTLARLDGLIPEERRLVVTHQDQIEETQKICGERCQYYLAEPEARNTAAALTLASLKINSIAGADSSPIMISLHADHIIQSISSFQTSLRTAVSTANRGFLTLIGIVPTRAETGYGYIEKGAELSETDAAAVYKVKNFREKPSYETATTYFRSGDFYWNAGYFIWKTELFLSELKQHLPRTVELLSHYMQDSKSLQLNNMPALTEVYRQLPKISVDNAVLELSSKVAVVEGNFGWFDIGSWDALSQCFTTDTKGNLLFGDVYVDDCVNSTIDTDDRFVACIGLKDMVVVNNKNAILVCPKDRAQDVKKIVEFLQLASRGDLT